MKSCDSRRWAAAGIATSLQAALLASSLVTAPAVLAADGSESGHQGHAIPVSGPNWAQTLKGQTIVEEALEGRAGRSEKVELQHHRLMRQMDQQVSQQAAAQWTSGGYNGMSMMHQYMGQDGSSFLLASDNKASRAVGACVPTMRTASSTTSTSSDSRSRCPSSRGRSLRWWTRTG